MKTIGLYPNARRDRNFVGTKKVIEIFGEYPVELLLPLGICPEFVLQYPHVRALPLDRVIRECDCLVTLGGDGTILSVAKRCARENKPICGINLGNVGFMAALEAKETEKIRRLMTGEYTVSDRMLLSCFVDGKEELVALNEVVIAPEKGFHIVELSLFVGRKKLCDFRADGLIFNTPTGSTGYAFSAGGAVMDSAMDAIGVKAISSYLLINAHHMIFRPETVFYAKKCRSSGCSVTVCADGREERVLGENAVVKICRSEKRVSLIEMTPRSNLEVFFRKF
ncbi:MAG: NAD(+)/NADH kinase [Clostridia bacterium]|nr:NAD(+)/NADH kinase [Clostridia bacterium]